MSNIDNVLKEQVKEKTRLKREIEMDEKREKAIEYIMNTKTNRSLVMMISGITLSIIVVSFMFFVNILDGFIRFFISIIFIVIIASSINNYYERKAEKILNNKK